MSGDASAPAPAASRPLLQFLSIGLVTVYVVWLIYWFRRWDFEDGYIVYRIVRNLFEQVGWSYNVGDRINPSPSPLTTVLTMLATKIVNVTRGDPELAIPQAGHLVGGLSIYVTCMSIRHLFARQGYIAVGTACALHLAYVLAHGNAWGTEVYLTCALLSLFLVVERSRTPRINWMILGFSFLASLDTIVVALSKSALEFWRHGLPRIRYIFNRLRRLVWNKTAVSPLILDATSPKIRHGLVPFFVPVLPWFTFSLILFDQLFPDILAAKMWQGRSGFWGAGPVYLNGLIAYLSPKSYLDVVEYSFAIIGWCLFILRRELFLYLLAFTIAQQAIYVFLDVPATLSHFVWIAVIKAIGLWTAVAFVVRVGRKCVLVSKPDSTSKFEVYGPYFALLLTGVWLGTEIRPGGSYSAEDARQVSYRKAAFAIEDDNRFTDGELASVEVGTLGFFTRRRILDFTGLTSRNPQFVDGRHNDLFFESNPAIIVLHDPPTNLESAIVRDPRFSYWYDDQLKVRDVPVPLTLAARTKLSKQELQDRITAATRSFDPIFMVNPVASPSTQCNIDSINGEKIIGRSIYRTNSPLLDIRGWAIRRDLELNPSDEVRIFLIGDLGKAFAVFSPRYELPEAITDSGRNIFRNAGFSVVSNMYAVPRGRYGVMIWQQGALCGPVVGLLYE